MPVEYELLPAAAAAAAACDCILLCLLAYLVTYTQWNGVSGC